MNQDLRNNKAVIRDFMRAQYTDTRLAQLLDHARSGKLSARSCCCFIGITTADHSLMPEMKTNHELIYESHYRKAYIAGGQPAEQAFVRLGYLPDFGNIHTTSNAKAQARLIPIIKAEIRRRMSLEPRVPSEAEALVEAK